MNIDGNHRVRVTKTVTVPMPYYDWHYLKVLARRNNVSIGEYIHGICKDAIAEEQEIALQRSGPQGRTPSREGREAGRPTTS